MVEDENDPKQNRFAGLMFVSLDDRCERGRIAYCFVLACVRKVDGLEVRKGPFRPRERNPMENPRQPLKLVGPCEIRIRKSCKIPNPSVGRMDVKDLI